MVISIWFKAIEHGMVFQGVKSQWVQCLGFQGLAYFKLCQFDLFYPPANSQFAIEHGPIEFVDLPLKHYDFP